MMVGAAESVSDVDRNEDKRRVRRMETRAKKWTSKSKIS